MSLGRFIYSCALYLLLPFVLLRLLLKSRRNKHYRQGIKERLGWLPFTLPRKKVIWVHAVSVGETIAAKPLIEELLTTHSQQTLLVTTTTPTGSETVKRLFGDRVLHCYFPYDLPHIIKRFTNKLKPSLLIVIETEIWPNLYATCSQKNIPVLMVNARLSTRSTQQYLRIRSLVKETLSYTTLIAARSAEDKQHFLSLGAPTHLVEKVGNIKFDINIDKHQLDQDYQLKSHWGKHRKVWVAASTHEGEDTIIVEIFKQLRRYTPDLLLIIVPRHPERFDDVYNLLLTSDYLIHKRSDKAHFNKNTDIILGDSMGELLLWYAVADIAFIGGSLVKTGGHNPLEATALGVPVVSGPYIFNFNDIYPPLCEAKIAWVGKNKNEIQSQLKALLGDGDHFKPRCETFMKQHNGVVKKLMHHINTIMD